MDSNAYDEYDDMLEDEEIGYGQDYDEFCLKHIGLTPDFEEGFRLATSRRDLDHI
jgi:hypothetical protein